MPEDKAKAQGIALLRPKGQGSLGDSSVSPHLLRNICHLRGVQGARALHIPPSALLPIFRTATVSLSASNSHLEYFIFLQPFSTSFKRHLGHVVDVNSKSATKDYGKIFSARAPYT